MNKFWIVLRHTYGSKLKTKQFIISTLIAAVLLVGFTNIQSIIDLFSHDKQKDIAVLDESGKLYQPFAKQVKQMDVNANLTHYDKGEQTAKKDIRDNKLDGYMVLSLNDNDMPKGTYKASKVAEEEIPRQLQKALQQVKVAVATQQLGLDPKEVSKVYKPVSFDKVALQKGAKSEDELNFARVAVYILTFLLYMSLIFYGMMIAMEVATEKSSRVMEILVSSVSPVKQMLGKIFGVVLLGITQIVFLGLVGAASIAAAGGWSDIKKITGKVDIHAVSIDLIVYAVVFFILGYFLYATLFAMLGSIVDRVEEAQQVLMPVMMLLIFAFIIAVTGLGNPSMSLITITSFIPFFAPMTMFLRVGMIAVPWWQVALSMAILVATIVFFIIVGAKVYRGGVLMYGKTTSWKNIKQALVLAKKEK